MTATATTRPASRHAKTGRGAYRNITGIYRHRADDTTGKQASRQAQWKPPQDGTTSHIRRMTDDGQARKQDANRSPPRTSGQAREPGGSDDARRDDIASAKQATGEDTPEEKKTTAGRPPRQSERAIARERHETRATQADRTHTRRRRIGTTPAHPTPRGRGTI